MLRILFIRICYKHKIPLKAREVSFYFKNYEHSFTIRTNTSDVLVLWALCLAGEYDIEWDKHFAPEVIIDAGANIGFFSLIMSWRFPNTKIIAIEPDKANYELLKKNIGNDKNIYPVLAGLWDKDTYLHVHSEKAAYSITVEESDDDTGVKSVCVDSLIKQYELGDKIDIFKMDIEGSEYTLFKNNYEKWIGKVKCYIIEIHDYFNADCRELIFKRLMEEKGYNSMEHMEDTIFFQDGVLKKTKRKTLFELME